MHNRVGPMVTPREMTLATGFVLWPLVLVILALALYPQLALKRGERAVERSLAKVAGCVERVERRARRREEASR